MLYSQRIARSCLKVIKPGKAYTPTTDRASRDFVEASTELDRVAEEVWMAERLRSENRSSFEREKSFEQSMVLEVERIYRAIENSALYLNRKLPPSSEFRLFGTAPEFVHEFIPANELSGRTANIRNFRGRFSNRHCSIVIRGRRSIEIFLVPCNELISMSLVETAPRRLCVLTPLLDNAAGKQKVVWCQSINPLETVNYKHLAITLLQRLFSFTSERISEHATA